MKKVLLMLVVLCVFTTFCLTPAFAQTSDESEIEVRNAEELEKAVRDNKAKKIIITKNISLGGTLYVGSNKTIIATGKTIKCNNGAARKNKVKNISFVGGTWKSKYRSSLFQFVHSKNITFKNANITCGIKGHAIELIACKNVRINRCDIKSVGKPAKDCLEEQIQIDIATPKTAPTVPKKLTKGQTCKNIKITNCKVSGARAVCANYASTEKKYQSKFHQDITIKNCRLIGLTSEALALFNAVDLKVTNNTIKTKSRRTGTPYSVGCHVHMFGKLSVKGNKNVSIKSNKVYGGREAILIYSHSSSKYGKATVKKNKAYCKAGRDRAIKIDGVKSRSVSGNKTYKW